MTNCISTVLNQLAAQRNRLIALLRPHCGHLDPEDLIAEATLRLAERLAAGEETPEHPTAYVLRSAKNLAIDHYRSARAREIYLDPHDTAQEPLLTHHDDTLRHRIEIGGDAALVRQAFLGLSSEQQRILVETAVHGRPPRDLASEFGTRAALIATAAHRARRALGNETLRLLLMRGDTECQRHARRISTRAATLPRHAANHLYSCNTCQEHVDEFNALRTIVE